jgi:glucose-6-phosphate 1-dehydrogenase
VDSGLDVDDAVFDRLARRMSYRSGDVRDAALYRSLATEIGGRQRPVYYLEVSPSLFGPVVEQLGAAKLLRDGRLAVEKPFGRDLASARDLDARLHRLLRESQILRVDHFLGKEPDVELEYLRFANLALAELWDRKSVSCVQITMAEDFGVEGRGRFYDSVGALRDVVQNHLLQVLALVAMDPPAGARAGDVPIFLRAGKALPHKVTEVRLLLRRTPRLAFLPEPTRAEPNQIVLRIDPDPGLRLQLSALAGQSWRTVHLDTSFARELGEPPEPYEVLLHAAMVGDHQYFAREDSVEETWRIVQPLLDHPPDVRPYPRGSWGPEEAETLLRGHPRWQQPWLPEEG